MKRRIIFVVLAVVMITTVWAGLVSAGQDKVTVCHKPGTSAEATLEIAAPAEAAHLAHGDTPGECSGPQSEGCTVLNAVIPDPQTNPNFYLFTVTGLDFFPGETIHADLTVTQDYNTNGGLAFEMVSILNSSNQTLANDSQSLFPEQQGTVSVDYVVVSGDDADSVSAYAETAVGISFTIDSVNFSCTPAP